MPKVQKFGPLQERVAFDEPVGGTNEKGHARTGFTFRFRRYAEFRYNRGSERVIAGALTGVASFKVRIAQSSAAAAMSTAWRMRDVRRGIQYQIREIDAISDRDWIWLVVESGVAIEDDEVA